MTGDSCILWSAPPLQQIQGPERGNESPNPDGSSALWEEYLKNHPGSWNGPLLQLIEADESRLIAAESDYRSYIEALSRGPNDARLFLAVTGVMSTDAGFVVGLRSQAVNRPSMWEFAPAGSLERFPIEEQLRREISEELGIDSEEVNVGEPVGIYLDRDSLVADVVVPVRVRALWRDVKERFESGEYSRVQVCDIPSLLLMLQDGMAVDGLFRQIVQWIQCGVIAPDATA